MRANCPTSCRDADNEQGSWVSQQPASAHGRNTPAQRVRDGQKERKQTDGRFLRGGAALHLPVCYDINEVIVSRQRGNL